MGDKIFNVLGSIVILAIITTVLLPDRQTVGVIKAGGDAFSGGLRAAMGK